jgi:hypothetical protein
MSIIKPGAILIELNPFLEANTSTFLSISLGLRQVAKPTAIKQGKSRDILCALESPVLSSRKPRFSLWWYFDLKVVIT